MRIRFLVLAVLLLLPPGAAAQEAGEAAAMKTATLMQLVLKDGSRMYGIVERETDDEIVFRTHVGASLTVRRDSIASLKKVSGSIFEGEFLPPDPNATRLFFAPTGRSLPKGQTYVGVYEFLMPFVQVGITDRISFGGGTPLLFGFGEGSDRPFWITPKVQLLDTRSTQVAAGVMHVFAGHDDGGGIAYTVVTRGNDVRSFTGGAGLAYGRDGSRAPVVMLGGDGRITRSMKVVTENYVWKGGKGVVSGGVRFIGERLSADLGLVVPFGIDALFVFPVINFVYVF